MGTDSAKVRNFSLVKGERPTVQDSPNPETRRWEIRVDTWARKLIVILIVLSASGVLVYRTWWLFMGAWITRNPPITNPAIYEQAIKYDPQNADYHFALAQIYNYSTQYLNIPRAGEEYNAAVRLNPDRSQHWLELSKYYEQLRDVEGSKNAMRTALEKDPNFAQTHWAAANLYIRLNDLKAADFELRRTADLDINYVAEVLDLVWRFYEDPDRIMSTHVPNTKDCDLAALDYFVGRKSERGTALAWAKLKTFETKRLERFNYTDYLVEIGKPHEAWSVFSHPAIGDASPAGVAADNLIYNPSFETEPSNGGFDWRITPNDHAELHRDVSTAKDGLASFLVTFDGKENLNYADFWHWIPVTKGQSYELSFWMKTEAISSTEGVFIDVDGQSSEKQIGSTYWQQLKIRFKAASDLATIRLKRIPSKKFDNLLKGKVWLDGFNVTAVR